MDLEAILIGVDGARGGSESETAGGDVTKSVPVLAPTMEYSTVTPTAN